MNYTKLFYWLTVADNAKDFFSGSAMFFVAFIIISTICYFIYSGQYHDYERDSDKRGVATSKKWMWRFYICFTIFMLLNIFTPTKRDSLLILAGGQTLNFLTTDSSAKRIPTELSGFLLTEIKNLSKEASVELNLNTQKEKILEEAKTLTSEELLKKIKTDSTFKKVLLE